MNIEATLEKVRVVARRMHLSLSTEKSYCHWISCYARWLKTAPPDFDSRKKVEKYLSAEALRGVSASTQNQAFNALLFLYRNVVGIELGKVDALRAKRQQHARHAPSKVEVEKLLREVRDEGGYPTRLIVFLLYGCGMRVNEPLALRIKDVDLANSRLTIREPKHGHDRVVSLPCSLAVQVQKQIDAASIIHANDVCDGVPVPLPGLLDKKYPRARFDLGWAWLFPMHRPCTHPRTGETVRWHVLDQQVQRAVRAAGKRAGLSCTVTPHNLRHAYATHSMQAGAYIRDIQAVLGHRSIETTMGYCHAEQARVSSPLEAMQAIAV